MCVGCGLTNAAGGISGLSALLASAFPVGGMLLLKWSRLFSLQHNSKKPGNYWRLGLLLAGYQLGFSVILGITGLALTNTSYGILAMISGTFFFVLLWLWFSWTIARYAHKWLIYSSFILVSIGVLPLLLLYRIPFLLSTWNLKHQLFLLTPILPEYSLFNLLVAFLSIPFVSGLIWIFQKLRTGGPAWNRTKNLPRIRRML